MMRRSTQNLGLNSLGPCSILNRDKCKGYAPVGCLRVPSNGYHFLTGVSFFQYFENNDIHLTFGDKFDSVVFLYALYEEDSDAPVHLLCVDEPVFQSYGLSEEIVSPPSSVNFVRFNTDEFLKNINNVNQESMITDNSTFKLSASRFVIYLTENKNNCDFKDIFCPPASASQESDTTDAQVLIQGKALPILDGADLEDDSKLAEEALGDGADKSKKKREIGKEEKKSRN